MLKFSSIPAAAVIASFVAFGASAADVPAPGASPRIDAIKAAGTLRVGVLANTPWLIENTSGSGEPFEGPAWILAKEYASRLGVTLQPVPVSHETKVPVLAANQVDMSITPLAETPERLKVVDFVLYSKTSVCIFGRADNEKFAAAANVDAINDPSFKVAFFIGGAEENWVKERFGKAELRGVTSSSAPAPIEEIMAKRADAAPINRVQWVLLNKKVRGLMALPKENNCQDSGEKAAPVGLAVDKGQDVYLEWLRTVEAEMQDKLRADEERVIGTMN
ncbi:substrate-binding periplasmic protein [Phyllobacterium brassicacearum]|uniref:substrate-binding periplasmic protein n=1 Tax=Phyllobacterium brassicacearum TaxID=314235 RepID=UPI0010E867EC|nr:transporter substrate-binding domain-containing protein [Phyllobacterium brassicacearum]TDQ17717.1 polar amino acid transport system substrate-binding protein [Phyllobacterium brassicacearum]